MASERAWTVIREIKLMGKGNGSKPSTSEYIYIIAWQLWQLLYAASDYPKAAAYFKKKILKVESKKPL